MEQSLSSLTYKGSVPAAIAEAKKQKKLFVVYISGEDADSTRLESSTWTDLKVVESILKYCILLHLSEGSNDAEQFSALYPRKSVPCITAVGYNGIQLWQNEGFVSAEVLASSLEKVWLRLHIQDTTAAVLSAALASKTSEPCTSGVSTTASSEQESSNLDVQSPSREKDGKSPDAITKVRSDKANEDKSPVCTVEEKSCEFESETSSISFDAKEAEHAGSEKFNSSILAAEELQHPAIVDPNSAQTDHLSSRAVDDFHAPEKVSDSHVVVSDGRSKSVNTNFNKVVQDEKGKAVDDRATTFDNPMRVNKLSDVHLNIRMPDGVNLQEKFSLTSTLRMVKDYVNEHQESVIVPYDLAIPYPRKVYTDQDLSRTLSELGLFDRQALIVVPHQQVTDQPNSSNIVESSNESNEGYFAYVKRAFSFLNPLSYIGGGSSSASPGQQSQHGMREYSPNSTLHNFSQEQQRPNFAPSSRNDGKARQPPTSRFGSNIHTLKHDEDEGRFNDRNSFWNGNSTQYGGNDNSK